MEQSIDILGLGCAAVDDVLYVDRYPPPDAKARVQRRERHCGGLTAAALIAAARLQMRCAYAGCLGTDDASQFVLRALRAEDVNVDHVRCEPHARPICSTIAVDQAHGTRNIYFDLNGLVALPPDWPDEDVIRAAHALLVDHFNVEAQIRAAQLARQERVPVIADFERLDMPGFEDLLELVDHLVVSLDFANCLTGCSDPADAALALWREGRQAVVVTNGSNGCWFATQPADPSSTAAVRSPVVQHQPAFQVQAVDTTGCGDVFHGAYAAALVRGLAVSEAVRFASAAAALKATRPGGASGAPQLSEVTAFMEAQQ
ncbi:MAG: PfkB family carbohydrate kinase [Pirellulales bacterium]